jgi:hypothetical protein
MNIKTLSAIAVVVAAVSSPVFAQDGEAASAQKPAHALRHYRSTYNQVPGYYAPRAGAFDADPESHVDRSRPGSFDPDFSPSGS